MLKSESVTQLLQVLELTRRSVGRGIPLERAYQDGIRDIANRHSVAYQTIGDLCRRRLGLEDISAFVALLEQWVRNSAEPLRRVIVKNSEPSAKRNIDAYFDGNWSPLPLNSLGSAFATPDPKTSERRKEPLSPPEEVLLRLSPELSRRLQLALLAGLGSTREEAALNLLERGFAAEKERIQKQIAAL